MSGNDEEMEWAEHYSTSGDTYYAETKGEAQVILELKWSEDPPPQRCGIQLEKVLQTWANSKDRRKCEVLEVNKNGNAKIKIKPPPAVSDLQELCGQTLTTKDKKTVTIMSVHLRPLEPGTQIPDNASEPKDVARQVLKQLDGMTRSSSGSKSQDEQQGAVKRSSSSGPTAVSTTGEEPIPETDILPVRQLSYINHIYPSNASTPSPGSKSQDEQPVKQRSSSSPAAGEETDTGILPVRQFLYINHIYKKEIEQILTKNGVTMKAEAHVTFPADKENGSPQDALSDFTTLVQKADGYCSVFPLKTRDPKELMDAVNIVLTKESKLLLTLSSEEMITCGPSQSRDAISKSFNTTTNINPSVISMSVHQELAKIKAKFGVDFKVSDISQSKVNVKTSSKGFGRNASMESHALRAPPYLYQKTATSPCNVTQPHGAVGFSGSQKNVRDLKKPEGASGGPPDSGPSQSRDAISKLFNTTTNINPSAGESTAATQDSSVNIDMSIDDPFLTTGLNFEENYWKVINLSFSEKLDDIKDKFGVDINVSVSSQGKVNVKTCYKGFGGNASMESHALRALLHLYQKTATSPYNVVQPHGAMGFNGSLKNYSDVNEPEGASGGPVGNDKPGYNIHYTEAPTGGGATPGDNKEEICPICFDTFTKKKQLECKHEFCEDCLEQSKKRIGPICPVCKRVFGKIEGDQPPGTMTWETYGTSLSGFPNCGSITITYDIPSGRQTEKHPNPGNYFPGITRTAYLPGNKEGKEVLQLLKRAFEQKLIFTVGTSRTTGIKNQVIWNDIHHKISRTGGTAGFGYPDPNYLSRVKDELKAKGIE